MGKATRSLKSCPSSVTTSWHHGAETSRLTSGVQRQPNSNYHLYTWVSLVLPSQGFVSNKQRTGTRASRSAPSSTLSVEKPRQMAIQPHDQRYARSLPVSYTRREAQSTLHAAHLSGRTAVHNTSQLELLATCIHIRNITRHTSAPSDTMQN